MPQDGAGELGEEALDEVEPGAMFGCEGELKSASGLLGQPSSGFPRDVRGMIVEDQLDRGAGRIGGIEQPEEFDELTAAVAVSDQGMNLPGEQINPSQQAERTMPFVLMIAHESRVDAGLRRQIGRGRCNGLDSWFFIVGDDGYRLARFLRFGSLFQDLDLAINAQNLRHLLLELGVATFQIIPHLVRGQVTMTVPFMRAYTELLVKTCHRRGAHAIGGMAAYIPSRKDPEVNEVALAKVREDKVRESRDGFDGTWVAHPDLVPTAREAFDEILQDQPNQKGRLRPDVDVAAPDLLNFTIDGGEITEDGLRHNINVGLQYLDAWLRGSGAVAIYNLMEDTATAEISRAQVWNWVHQLGAALSDGRKVTLELYRHLVPQELEKIRKLYGDQAFAASKLQQATSLFNSLIGPNEFPQFLTLIAYPELE